MGMNFVRSVSVNLTKQESEALKVLAKKQELTEDRVFIHALRMYQSVTEGDSEIVYKRIPVGCPELE